MTSYKSSKRDLERIEQKNSIGSDSILLESHGLVHGDRNEDYGHPIEDFDRTAKLMSAVLGFEVRIEQVPLLMMCVKLSRQCHAPKRDNLVDIAGYAETAGMLDDRQ